MPFIPSCTATTLPLAAVRQHSHAGNCKGGAAGSVSRCAEAKQTLTAIELISVVRAVSEMNNVFS
jgi:hypothetical protein